MKMRRNIRKIVLTAHLTVSIGWIGAVIAYLVLVVGAWTNVNTLSLQAAWIGMELIGWYAILPLAITALITGIIMGMGTHWGLFRHYWVVFSLILTVLALGVLIGHLPTVSSYADAAVAGTITGRAGLYGELLHAGGGLVVLLVIVGLNVYKPPGLTPYGHRKR